jgi:two-component system, NtrC family, response regulator AtoC
LRNIVERAVLLVTNGTITREQLPADKMERAITRNSASSREGPRETRERRREGLPGGETTPAWREKMAAIEKQAIQNALERCAGNKAHAAEWLGMPRSTFFARLKALDMS